MTCYREGDFLLDAWESILNQTESKWQVVLVKDGGADELTSKIFHSLSHPNLKKIELKKNQGPYVARNIAVKNAESEYIIHLDADDQLSANCIERILNKFESYPDLDFTYADLQRFGEDNKHKTYPLIPKINDLCFQNYLPGQLAYKKYVWEILGHYTEELKDGMADYDFNIGLIEHGFKGEHIEQGYVYYYYRVKQNGHVSKSYSNRIYEKRQIIVSRHPDFFKEQCIKNKFLGFGALMTAYAYGIDKNKKLCRKYALLSLKHGYYRLGAIFMIFFGIPTNFMKKR